MLRNVVFVLSACVAMSVAGVSVAADDLKANLQKGCTDPAKAGPDYNVQGEYVGRLKIDGHMVAYGIQVIALGDGKFHAVGYRGGLPGAGWDKSEKIQVDGQTTDGAARFVKGPELTMTIRRGNMIATGADGQQIGALKRIARKSPTLGEKPPAGAVVLFDGTSADKFEGGRMTEDHLLMEGVTSKRKFQSFTIHLEFCLSFKPYARGQDRGNSGLYAQGRYETQILDSFGLEGKNNECGGVYEIAEPAVNACLPPLAWQTYDVDFTAAEFRDGKKVKDAQMTVRLNGIEIHKDLKLPRATRAAPVAEGAEPGPIYLQDHGNPVRFRNIWVVPKS